MEKRRPDNVTAVCSFFWLHALAAAAYAVVVVWLAVAPYAGDSHSSSSGFGVAGDLALGCCCSMGLAAIAALFAGIGWGLWRLKPWARRAAIAASGFMILFSLPGLATLGACGALYGIVLYGLVIWQLSYKGVKAVFEPHAVAQFHPGTLAKNLPSKRH